MRDRIKAIRKHAGMTQAEFASALGLGPYGTANWEKKDPQIPTESMQLLICKTFGINKTWLETGEGEMLLESKSTLVAELATKHNLSPMERGIISKFVEMDADRRAMFLEVARSLLDAGDIAAAESSADLVEKRSCPPGSETMSG